MAIKKLIIDFESRSCADLKKVGAVKYSKDATTEIICLAYKYNDEKTKIWVPSKGKFPDELKIFLNSPDVEIHGHNVFFEYCLIRNVLSRKEYAAGIEILPFNRFHCTAAKAAACAIPRSLAGAGEVMKLPIQKDMEGNRLIIKYCKPRPAYKKASDKSGLQKYYDDEFELEAIYDYCVRDVDTEYLLDKSLPDLSEYERGVWILNQEMNFRGVNIDLKNVKNILSMVNIETKSLQKEFYDLTGGKIDSVLKRDQVLKFLRESGLDIPNMQAGVIKEILDRKDIPPLARRVLEIKSQVGKTSTKKYHAFLTRVCDDGRVRDLSLYHGASTGRESGSGIQVQNFPKGSIKNTDYVIDEIISTGDLDFIKLCYPDPFEVFSSVIRGMITATPGYKIYAADYNAIECRIAHWLSDNQTVLNDFKNDKDPYVKAAARVLNKLIEKIDTSERQFGKVQILACQYGMGPDKFFKTCHAWGVTSVTEDLAKKAVKDYRESNKKVVEYWAALERAAVNATLKKGKVFKAGKISYFFKDDFLWCELPSKRRLAYRSPFVKNEPTPWGETRARLYFGYVDGLTKKWTTGPTYGGALFENVCQATARDITVNGMIKAKKAGYEFLFQVHDEIVCESQNGDTDQFEKIVTDLPAWALDLPVKAEAWCGFRYKKG